MTAAASEVEVRPREGSPTRFAAWAAPFGRWARAAFAEPLVRFLLIGAAIFVGVQLVRGQGDRHRIVVTPAHVAELSARYAAQMGSPPDAATLEALVQDDIRDEILFRQGIALGLDKDDLIIRRRVLQKMQFLHEDLAAPPAPTEAELKAFYAAHPDRYGTAPRTTFSHVFFSSDKAGSAAARARAVAVLAKLSPGVTRAPEKGDPFPDRADFAAYEPQQVQRLFGQTAFSQAVATAPVGRWSGPYASAYGWHLLYVSDRQAAGREPFESAREAVLRDARQARQEAANKAGFERVAKTYRIVRADRPGA